MGGKTDYYRNRLLDAELRGQTLTFPATWYVALFLQGSPPSAAGGGTEVAGPSVTTGYQRQAISAGLALWLPTQGSGGAGAASSGSTGRVSNASSITFGAPLTNWGTVAYFALMDALTSGNMWRIGALATPYVGTAGASGLTFPADSFAIYEV